MIGLHKMQSSEYFPFRFLVCDTMQNGVGTTAKFFVAKNEGNNFFLMNLLPSAQKDVFKL